MANCCVQPSLEAIHGDVVNVGVGCAEGGLLEEARGIFRGDDRDGRRAVDESDEVGRGGGAGSRIENLEVEVAGFAETESRGELGAAVEGGGDGRAVHENLRAVDEFLTLNDDGGGSGIEG